MKLSSRSFGDGGVIPGRCAFGLRDPRQHVRLSQNLNPQLSWRGAPPGTRSFVLTCIDSDVPTRPDDVNKEGREVPASLPRAEFVHWLMADIPVSVTALAEGSCSRGVIPKGKQQPAGPAGSRQGVNDYSSWLAGDAAMGGTWLGYDGPCPPWNDARVHHYRFTVMATDLESSGLGPKFTLAELRRKLEGHVLASAGLTGRYSLNPRIQLK